MSEHFDFLVIGAGVVGITTALEMRRRHPSASIAILEKESAPGRHSSGRNSGVLHSGIYYPPESLKARVCTVGARRMAEYCAAKGLPLNRVGKVLVPTRAEDVGQFELLASRAGANGIAVERWSAAELGRREPETRSAIGEALFVPATAVVDSQAVLRSLVSDAVAAGIRIMAGGRLGRVDERARRLDWAGTRLDYGHAFNTAGLHADTVAKAFGVGADLRLLPFKGLYWKLSPDAGFDIRHLIYPVPDLAVPFLGVHTTTAIDGTIYLGPTSVPAWGRENYRGVSGIDADLPWIAATLMRQFTANADGFRRLALQEAPRYLKSRFAEAARRLLPRLHADHLLPCDKVGIRAQMFDRRKRALVTDFLVRSGPSSTHVLNAISPAFTSAFPLAEIICDHAMQPELSHADQG